MRVFHSLVFDENIESTTANYFSLSGTAPKAHVRIRATGRERV